MTDERILTIDETLAAEDVEYAVIPTWKTRDRTTGQLVQGYTRIGSLSAEDVIEWRDTLEGPAKKTMGIRLLVNSLVDENGKRIGSPQHYEAFKKKSNAIMERILEQIVKLNGMTVKKDAETKKD